jgi:enamine deaminase RidA (YjgF/YER057c/UK114 family)
MKTPRLLFGMIIGTAIASAAMALAAPRRRNVNTASEAPARPFSSGVLVGDTLYLSGELGVDPRTGKPAADVDVEARLALQAIDPAAGRHDHG